MAKSKVDKYANILQTEVTMTGANALTFTEIDIGASLFDRVALLIHRTEYVPSTGCSLEFLTNADSLWMALTSTDQITDLSADERSVLDYVRLIGVGPGGGTAFNMRSEPVIHSFEGLPQGGILVAPRPLFFGMDTAGFAGAAASVLRMYFTIIKLADADYFELLETRRFFG